MPSLKRFSECESSVFISYAHDDDELNNSWISNFAAELKRDLAAALARENLGREEMPKVYLSKFTGPVAGDLALQLRDQVARCFAMVIVIDEKYASSEWCLKELSYFYDAFGPEGLDQRLSIVVLRDAPRRCVTARPEWQQWFAGRSPVWREFFDPDDLNSAPVPVLRDDGPGMTNAMFRLYKPVRDDLVNKIRTDLSQALPVKPLPRWVLGFSRPELKPAVQHLADRLAEHEPLVGEVPREALDSRKNLRALLERAESLILPFNQGQPIIDAIAGGHVALQLDVWRELKKRDDAVLLLDLSGTVPADPAELAEDHHRQYLADCKLDRLSADQVVDRLVPRPAGSDAAEARRPSRRVRVFIESNRNEPDAWKKLGAQIRHRWDKLIKARAVDTQLSLRTDGFDIDRIDDFQLDQADGVVLLWGQKDSRSLLSQINRVEDIFIDPAPAIVAHLSPPQPRSQQRMPAMQWDVLRFCGRDMPPAVLEPDGEDDNSLDTFVADVLDTTLRRCGIAPRP